MGSIMGIFFFIMGRFPGALVICVLIALLSDLLAYFFKYKSKKGLLASFIVFSYSTIGPVIPLFLFPNLYVSELAEVGKDATYIQNIFSSISQNTFYLLIVGIFVAAIIGGLFGQRMMNKHFKKAGIV